MLRMYHILKLRKFYASNTGSLSSSLSKHFSKRKCPICEHPFVPQQKDYRHLVQLAPQVRLHSTHTNTAEISKSATKKKKRRAKKKYVELLEVTENSSTQRKASISKLKAKDLSLLVENPNIDLSQLHSLRKQNTQFSQGRTAKNLLVTTEVSYSAVDPITDKESGANIYSLSELDPLCGIDVEPSAGACHSQVLDDLNVLVNKENTLLDENELFQRLEAASDVQLHDKYSEDGGSEFHDLSLSSNNVLEEESPVVGNENLSIPFTLPDQREKYSDRRFLKSNLKHSMKEKLAKVKLSELEIAGREESFFQNMHCYLETCIRCNMLNRGMAALSSYRLRNKQNKRPTHPNVVALYNIILQGFSKKGNLKKVKEIMHMLQEDQVAPNVHSFAACLECAGRLPENDGTKIQLVHFLDEMKEANVTLNDVFAKCSFVGDQQEVTLAAVRRILPDFEPCLPPPETCYSCSLLKELNENKEGNYKSPADGLLTNEQISDLMRQQFQIELDGHVKVKTIEKRTEPNATIQHYREKLEEAQKSWRKSIHEAFERDVEVLRVRHSAFKAYRTPNLYPFLKILDPDEYTEIIMQEIRKLAEGSETFSPTLSVLHKGIAQQVRARCIIKFREKMGIMNKMEHLYSEYFKWYMNPVGNPMKNTREKWQYLLYENMEGPSVCAAEKAWPNNVLNNLGKFLYNIILKDIKIDVNVTKTNSKTRHLLPAFYSLFRYHGRILKEEVKPHPVLSRLFRGAAQADLMFDVTTIPMLCPPVPWTSVSSGGYLVAKANVIRLAQETCQQWQRLEESPPQQLFPALDSLSQLGSIPWTVNKSILDVVINVFNNGGSKKLDIPLPPSACPTPDAVTPEMTKVERYEVYRKRMLLRRQKAEMYSLWCDALYRLSLANHFRDKIFWLPHNMDFRGRVYPCPPHLNHLGSDMARSLLQFAKGQPLGPHGLKWLKIHLVNLTALKKKNSLDERLQFANEMMPEVLDSADYPLTGRMWWAESEEPWQTLACCIEIAKAVRSPDPEKYICHFPVHQDGSCNGLQHYAALGRDTAGAESVNLSPAQRPQDVYECVAQLVERERAKDAQNNVKIAQVLEGFVQRKVIKQTVMTTVYGVTRFGARLQIARQLKDLEGFPKEFVWPASTYLVTKTFDSLREMFTSTKEIQDWFTECARLISQICGQNVEWITPLGLPVVQPYFRPPKNLKFKESKVEDHFHVDMFERPNVMKQKNAFPPNFIHSLDSSHMMLTSLFCERNNVTFVSVHDCYWTHPSTVNVMNKICRDQFVALHSQPILESLSRYLVEKYSYPTRDIKDDGSLTSAAKLRLNKILQKVPQKGDFNLQEVLESIYFFS
ncbi:DNA-directed RNA polymerase, mitochondrial [Schistocerca americana]|uniref:DNA-directed RNA polymerase, mitochondrial n=1 Tax=Schistocerca americana TaxID=7009 RepID=UPI001F4F8CD9|nr:DNA-directed RNA polymerase, mitochondrial [Schistocerca americana]